MSDCILIFKLTVSTKSLEFLAVEHDSLTGVLPVDLSVDLGNPPSGVLQSKRISLGVEFLEVKQHKIFDNLESLDKNVTLDGPCESEAEKVSLLIFFENLSSLLSRRVSE